MVPASAVGRKQPRFRSYLENALIDLQAAWSKEHLSVDSWLVANEHLSVDGWSVAKVHLCVDSLVGDESALMR